MMRGLGAVAPPRVGCHRSANSLVRFRAAYVVARWWVQGLTVPIFVQMSGDQLADASNQRERGLVLGRSRRLADVVVPEAGLARRHVRLVVAPDGSLAIEDLASARETKVNDKPLRPYERVAIREVDRIALNGVALTLKGEPRC
jgi:hypothetical protein